MEIEKRKIGLFLALFVIAGIIFYVTSGGGNNTQNLKKTSQPMLCTNLQCNAEFKITLEEVREASSKMDVMGGGFLCPVCGKESSQIAEKCPYCEHTFIPYPSPGDFRDRCPKCGKSKMEEMRK